MEAVLARAGCEADRTSAWAGGAGAGPGSRTGLSVPSEPSVPTGGCLGVAGKVETPQSTLQDRPSLALFFSLCPSGINAKEDLKQLQHCLWELCHPFTPVHTCFSTPSPHFLHRADVLEVFADGVVRPHLPQE